MRILLVSMVAMVLAACGDDPQGHGTWTGDYELTMTCPTRPDLDPDFAAIDRLTLGPNESLAGGGLYDARIWRSDDGTAVAAVNLVINSHDEWQIGGWDMPTPGRATGMQPQLPAVAIEGARFELTFIYFLPTEEIDCLLTAEMLPE